MQRVHAADLLFFIFYFLEVMQCVHAADFMCFLALTGPEQAMTIKKQLAASGIPYVVLGDTSLWEKSEV